MASNTNKATDQRLFELTQYIVTGHQTDLSGSSATARSCVDRRDDPAAHYQRMNNADHPHDGEDPTCCCRQPDSPQHKPHDEHNGISNGGALQIDLLRAASRIPERSPGRQADRQRQQEPPRLKDGSCGEYDLGATTSCDKSARPFAPSGCSIRWAMSLVPGRRPERVQWQNWLVAVQCCQLRFKTSHQWAYISLCLCDRDLDRTRDSAKWVFRIAKGYRSSLRK